MLGSLLAAMRRDPAAAAAWLIAAAGAAALVGAWIIQYGFGVQPCPLCLEQRWPYYFVIPLALVLAFGKSHGGSPWAMRTGFGVLGLLLLGGAALGAYHAGVEWKWWAGPQDCSGPNFGAGAAGTLLQRMQTTRVVRCDEAALRIFGLSLAGWNVLISLSLAAVALFGMRSIGSRSFYRTDREARLRPTEPV